MLRRVSKNVLKGELNWSMVAHEGTKIKNVLDFFLLTPNQDTHNLTINLLYNNEPIIGKINHSPGNCTLYWRNSSISDYLTSKYGSDKEYFNQLPTKGSGIMIEKVCDKFHISFYFTNGNNTLDQDLDSIYNNKDLSDTEKLRDVLCRLGQGAFRDNLLTYWDNCCAVTGCKNKEVLKASHIKPWSKCISAKERLDKYNGLLLSPNLDALFDKGLITFTSDGSIKISNKLTKQDMKMLGIGQEMAIKKDLTKQHIEYLDFHNQHVFSKHLINFVIEYPEET